MSKLRTWLDDDGRLHRESTTESTAITVEAEQIRSVDVPRGGLAAGWSDRFTADWFSDSLGPDEKITGSIETIRNRLWGMVGENSYLKGFLNIAERNIFGATGFHLENKCRMQRGKKLDRRANKMVLDLWSRFNEKENASANRRWSRDTMDRIAMTHIILDGDVLYEFLPGFPHRDNEFQFSQHLHSARTMPHDNHEGQRDDRKRHVRHSIEVDEWGGHIAYLIQPNRQSHGIGYPGDIRRIPAGSAIFPMRQWCIADRGWPWPVAAILQLRHLEKYETAELIAARVSASKMGFFKTGPEGYTGSGENADGSKRMRAQAGTFEDIGDKDFVPFDPKHPTQSFPEFRKAMLRGVAAAMGTSYHALGKDLSDVNFSSIRQGEIEEREGWLLLQYWWINEVEKPRFRKWLAWVLARGMLPGLTLDDYERLHCPTWLGRRWDYVDPEKDLKADKLKVELGATSPRRVARSRGNDFDQVVEETAEDMARLREAGAIVEDKNQGAVDSGAA